MKRPFESPLLSNLSELPPGVYRNGVFTPQRRAPSDLASLLPVFRPFAAAPVKSGAEGSRQHKLLL